VKEDEMGSAYSMNVVKEECIREIGGKARRKKPLERLRRKLADNIKIDLREKECDVVWTELAQETEN
jgi:hypothetical protein